MHKYEKFAKPFLREVFEQSRHENNLSQEKMAERLMIGVRAYSDLATGKSCCSTTTLLFYMAEFGKVSEIFNISKDFRESVRKEQEQEPREVGQDG